MCAYETNWSYTAKLDTAIQKWQSPSYQHRVRRPDCWSVLCLQSGPTSLRKLSRQAYILPRQMKKKVVSDEALLHSKRGLMIQFFRKKKKKKLILYKGRQCFISLVSGNFMVLKTTLPRLWFLLCLITRRKSSRYREHLKIIIKSYLYITESSFDYFLPSVKCEMI